ncbi:MAG TPA: histidine kinase [Caulobacteraceae bacterium]|nr:histidine kinase [Caulobacteraceae bacterium]
MIVVALGAVVGLAASVLMERRALKDELSAALVSGHQRVLSQTATGATAAANLRELLRSFDGDRHMSISLAAPGPAVRARSIPLEPAWRAPAWFKHIVDPHVPDVRMPLDSGGAMILSAEPGADAGDAWVQFRNAVILILLVSVAGLVLVYLTLDRALRPLQALTAAFRRVGAGNYDARVPEQGPAELVRLSESFNVMAADLAAMHRRTRMLEEQILKLQDEERSELARDLHDEIGPHLFAASIDATVACRALEGRGDHETARLVRAIGGAISQAQHHVREILTRLRPTKFVEIGLDAAIEELFDFWRSRKPEIEITRRMAPLDARLPYALQELAYRTIQEGLTNAVRHAHPRRIDVEIAVTPSRLMRVQVADDGVGERLAGQETGFGLVGMRERVEALGGQLSITPGTLGGWSVVVEAPIPDSVSPSAE